VAADAALGVDGQAPVRAFFRCHGVGGIVERAGAKPMMITDRADNPSIVPS
jgi:hypothetical protein